GAAGGKRRNGERRVLGALKRGLGQHPGHGKVVGRAERHDDPDLRPVEVLPGIDFEIRAYEYGDCVVDQCSLREIDGKGPLRRRIEAGDEVELAGLQAGDGGAPGSLDALGLDLEFLGDELVEAWPDAVPAAILGILEAPRLSIDAAHADNAG